ncbi:hypothetical protein AVEN_214365-1 [Araneus ventricosus]|uniref:Uncharacterized protein n=1 Tax=Araneus ventricosus TaxID=182803 RepID=A0A4Y2IYX0_ARAVE|nr:hypothetical protein AVEN_245964-1 [Araneus ventricosus]GBM82844.1 hypothetical protein AVEN_264962-1 [Araneus ventricosus]GBM83008.1 hypothetical protein AVEN_167674-1 [Araneus ventricosus]GBM83049.1 hypothetical protein AVEN_214365-1 [Araneus ventricosus]
MVSRSIVNKERNYIFPKNSTRRPKPPESGFCRTGGLRRNRAHRVKSKVQGSFSTQNWKIVIFMDFPIFLGTKSRRELGLHFGPVSAIPIKGPR